MKLNRQITAVSRRARTACFGLRRGCDAIFPDGVTLTVWRAGCWPQEVCTQVEVPCTGPCCGPCYETTCVDTWPTRVLYTGMDVDAQGRVCFVLDDLLFDQGPGRYDADLVACGKTVRVHLQVEDALEVSDAVSRKNAGVTTGCLITNDCSTETCT